MEAFQQSLILILFPLLPVVGLISGPAYAPLLFGLTAVITLGRAALRQAPGFDAPLTADALLFLAICALGVPGAIEPGVAAAKLAQISLILIVSLLLWRLPPLGGAAQTRLFRLMRWSVLVGVLLLCLDSAIAYPLQKLVTAQAPNAATKYNRGLIALVLLTWPLLGDLLATGRRKSAAGLAALVGLATLVGLSSTGLAAFATGLAVAAAAALLPRLIPWLLGLGMTLLALTLPWDLRLISGVRSDLAPMIKPSGLHRLEIWDYMSARILEAPWRGWGLGNAKFVPIRDAELARYLYVSPNGVYPHNQWIQLWIETGLPGVLTALAALWLVLWRLRRGEPWRLAALASVLVVTLLNFEITTDSWWATLAGMAWLFRGEFKARP